MNPFKYGRVVSEDDFCPRPRLEKELITHISGAQNVLLEGERRTGKTSLIYEVSRRMKDCRLLYIDIMEIKSVDDFCRRIVKALVSMEQKEGLAKKVFKSLSYLKPTMSLDPVTGTPSISLDSSVRLRPDSIEGLLDFIETESKKKTIIVAFDEFQDVLNLKQSRETLAILRSKVQFHADIPYIFSGSVRNQMDQIFNYPEGAFFKSAITLNVGSLEKNTFKEFLQRKLKSGKRELAADLLEEIFDITNEIPGDVQQLCGALWEVTEPGDTLTKSTIPQALELIYSRELKGYEIALNQLSGQQLRCLTGLARLGGKSPFSKDFLALTGINQPGSVKKALTRLLDLRILYHHNKEKQKRFLKKVSNNA